MRFKIFLCAVLFSACGEDTQLENQAATSTCSANTVVIQVMDGFLQSACGCNEGVKTIPNGSTFNCTFAAGKTVFFFSNGIQTQHQIQIQSVFTGPVWDGFAQKETQSFGVRIPNAGTYSLTDLFYPQATGTLTAL